MDWNVNVVPEPVVNIAFFNELLGKLRSAHEEVCARNALLELHVGSQSPFETKVDDPWLPINFLPPKDSPAHHRLPWGSQKGPLPKASSHTPRVFELRASDTLARQQESQTQSLCQRIDQLSTDSTQALDKLAKEQEHLGEHIAKILAMSAERQRSSKRAPSKRVSATNGSEETSEPDVREVRISKRVSIAERVTQHWREKERFKVKTGNTREFKHLGALGTKSFEEKQHDRITQARLCLQNLLVGAPFSIASSFLILCYAILIAIETDTISQDPEQDSAVIKYMHYFFTIVFALELLLRCLAYGYATWCGVDAFWNRLDAFLILSGLSEMFMENALGEAKSAGSVMRGVRIARVVRTIRLVRTFRQFHDFQKMAYALLSSMRTLVCSLALLVFVMFFFAVWITQSAADIESRDTIQDLELRFGRLMSTMYTLFLSVSNGISWDECFMPLHKLSWLTAQVFVFYVVIVLFGVLNVVTSVFVESVIRSVQHHKDLIVQDKEEERTIAMAHMREVFRQVDSDGSGQVSIDELDFFLQDPALRKYMEALSIEADDTRLLFRLLDGDDSGAISAEEFCEGCLRLKGQARSIDIHILTFRIKNFLERWSEFTGYVEEALSQIRVTQVRDSRNES